MTDRQQNRARRMRKAPTISEALMWRTLRGRRLEDLKFRRQVPIGPYIVDFACLKRRLVIEVDGGVHDAPFRDPTHDDARDAWLRSEGYRVLRFKNGELEVAPHLVLGRILAEVGQG